MCYFGWAQSYLLCHCHSKLLFLDSSVLREPIQSGVTFGIDNGYLILM